MQRFALELAEDWLAPGAVLTKTVLDTTVHVSSLNHPALTPYFQSSPGTQQLGDVLFAGTGTPPASLNGGNAWYLVDQILVTAQAGDSCSLTTSGPQVIAQLTGQLLLGMVRLGGANVALHAIRNGALVHMLVDGVLHQTIDLAHASPQVVWINPDGQSHTLSFVHTGVAQSTVQPIGPIMATVGHSVALGLSLAVSTTQQTLHGALWTLTATGAGTYTLAVTPRGGTLTTVVTGLTTGTVYDSVSDIPGVAFSVTGTLTSGDAATFTTDQILLGIQWIQVDTGSGGTTGEYVSAIFDSHSYETQWLGAVMTASDLFTGAIASATIALQVGSSSSPDSTWQTIPGTFMDVIDPVRQTRIGRLTAGFLGDGAPSAAPQVPRARFAQLIFTFPLGIPTIPWIQDLVLHAWIPESDTMSTLHWPVPDTWEPTRTICAIQGGFTAQLLETRTSFLDFWASMAITTAQSAYLQAIGLDLGVAPYLYTLVPPLAYRTILRSLFGSKATPSSGVVLATQVGALLAGDAPTVASSVVGGLLTVTASAAVLTAPVVVRQTAPFHVHVTIPAATTNGYPGLAYVPIPVAQQIITRLLTLLTPLGTALSVTFS